MKKNLLFLFIIISSTADLWSQSSDTPMGINLSRLYSTSSEIPFVDVFKQSEDWITTDVNGVPPSSPAVNLPLDSNGYPLQIPYNDGTHPPQIASTVMLDIEEGRYPSGTYTLMFEGDGEIELNGDASGTFNQSSGVGSYTFTVNTPSPNGIRLSMKRSGVSNHVRNIRVIMPGHAGTYMTQPFYPDFIQKLQGIQVIRFMDWARTNGAWWTTWSQRNLPTYRTHAISGGVPYEIAATLCNTLNADMWINIAHQVDDNYITQLARLIRDTLNSTLKVYIEYSNELWNGGFSQKQWTKNQGNTLGFGASTSDQTGRYFWAKRSAEIFKIFEDEFGNNKTRLVKLLAVQATNTTVTTQLLAAFALPSYNSVPINPNGIKADALAIAPYFGNGIADDIAAAGLVNSVTIQTILDSTVAYMQNPQRQAAYQQQRTLANQNNMKLIAYEGGQSLRANVVANQNNATLTQKLVAANRDPRMYNIYKSYFENWFNNLCGGVFCHFSYARVPNQYGSWGIIEYPAQPFSTAHKYRAMRAVIDTPQVLSAGFSYVINGFNVSFTNASTRATGYSWNFGDGSPVDTASNPAHSYSNPGQYIITLSAENSCDSVVFKDTLNITATAVQDNVADAELMITPNPNNGIFEVILPSSYQGDNCSIEISSALGQVMQVERLSGFSNENSKKFDIASYGKGIYLVNVNTNNKHTLKKILIY